MEVEVVGAAGTLKCSDDIDIGGAIAAAAETLGVALTE